jgi:hypothetical protein
MEIRHKRSSIELALKVLKRGTRLVYQEELEERKQAIRELEAIQWVGLDDEEVHQAFCHVEYETNHDWNNDPESWCKAFYRYVEARLKEKNQ